MTVLHCDFETFSACDLRSEGLDNYARHPSTGVHCMAWAFDDEPVQLWTSWQPIPIAVQRHVENDGLVYAHNSAFELAIWNHILHAKRKWPRLEPEQTRCTMAMAYAMGLPGKLEHAAPALGISERKDTTGARIMMQLAQPKKDGSFWVPADDPEKFQKLYDYCRQDVAVERAMHKRLVELSDHEQAVWNLDYRINQRGIRVDLKAIDQAIKLVEQQKQKLNAEMLKITEGVVGSCSEVQLLVKWIRSQGVEMPGVAKADVLDALSDPALPWRVRAALDIRKEAAKSSTAKLASMKARADKDGIIRNAHQYHGAATGRWAGRGIQVQNLPRPRPGIGAKQIQEIVDHFDQPVYLDMMYGPVLDAVADSIRGMIVPRPGHHLIACDFSAVEARVLAWLAGEQSVLEVFKSHGKIYEYTAAAVYRKRIEDVTKDERQVGKVAELACLGERTMLLTNTGYKPIVEVSLDDLLWDGREWAKHEGLVSRGIQRVISVDGLEVTPDHLIDIRGTWTLAQEPASNESILRSALASGLENSPSYTASGMLSGLAPRNLSAFSARAVGRPILSVHTIFAGALRHAATAALRKVRAIGAKISGPTRTSFRMMRTAGVSSIASLPASIAATTPTTRGSRTTADAASTSLNPGASTDEPSSLTSFHWMDGIFPIWNWIERMWTKDTNPAISGLSPGKLTPATNEVLASCKNESQSLRPTFDILNCGSRNSFLVKTNSGHLLVHNCGYGGGKGAFQQMARGYNVKVKDETAENIKLAWRESHPHIVRYWYALENAALEALRIPHTVKVGPKGREVAFKKNGSFLWCRLPSGRVLCYPYPEIREVETPWGEPKEALTYMASIADTKGKVLPDSNAEGKWQRVSTYGGSLAENVTQAVARDLLADAMLRMEVAGYQTVMHVHDEAVIEVPETAMESTLAEVEKLMAQVPSWAEGLPLAAEGWRGTRYRK